MRFIRPVLGALLAALLAHAIPTQSCARYFPDSNPATGTGRNVPFGSPTMQSLTSLFNANNGGSSGGAVYFDLKAHNQRLYLHALGINTNAPIGTELIADVYSLHHSHVGREATPSLWRARTMARGTAAGLNNPSTLEFDRSILVQPVSGTTVGIAVVARNFAHRYTDGANTYGDANVTWTLGAASNAPFTSPIIAPRTANMTLHYQLATTPRHNQMYQTILRSADLGGPGSITGLAFAPMQSGKHYMRDLQIRMAHKPPGYNLSLEFYANLAPAWWSATTVLAETDYTWHLTKDQWNGVGFSLPFDYDGVSDVIVQIATRDNHMESGAPAWFHSSPVQERLYATGFEFWRPPPVWHGTHSHSSGLKMRVDFGCGESGEFGTSCGPARAEGFSRPNPGTNYWFDLHEAPPGSSAILVMGTTLNPQDLSNYGFTNCRAWTDGIASVYNVASSTGFAWHQMSLPNTTAYNGMRLYGYWANLDSTAPGGLTTTNYVRMIIGS